MVEVIQIAAHPIDLERRGHAYLAFIVNVNDLLNLHNDCLPFGCPNVQIRPIEPAFDICSYVTGNAFTTLYITYDVNELVSFSKVLTDQIVTNFLLKDKKEGKENKKRYPF